jgi:hypothetical protein
MSLKERIERAEGELLPLLLKEASRPCSSFFTAAALSAMPPVPSLQPAVGILKSRLQGERGPLGSFRYAEDYPDDLDTTSLALYALAIHDESTSAEALANYVHLLFATEVKEGGPYRTWLVNEAALPAWKDVDPCVNANIAAFLKLEEVELAGLNDYLQSVVDDPSVCSPYYPSRLSFYYFLSRSRPLREIGINEEGLSVLELALLLSARLRSDLPVEGLMEK